MLIGLISDTHDHIPHLEKAIGIFREREVDEVFHSGDYCSPFMIPPFEGLTLKGVFGNNDGDKRLIIEKFDQIDARIYGEFFEKDIGGLNIAVYHGTHPGITEALRTCGNHDVVVTGHTHEQVDKTVGNTLVVNPGSAHGFDGTASVALLDTETREVEFIEL